MKADHKFSSLEEQSKEMRSLLKLCRLTRQDVADELGVTISTVDSWMRKSGGNHITIDKYEAIKLLGRKKAEQRVDELMHLPLLQVFTDIELVRELNRRGWECKPMP